MTLENNPAPDLQVTAVDIPATLQPGDVITPTIRISNYGLGDPGNQGPVTVALVASLDKDFGPGDVILSTFTINSLPGINAVPTQTSIANTINLYDTPNEFTITVPTVALPATPGFYYFGIKIDPVSQINQTYAPTAALSAVVPVGPADQFLTPATVLVNTTTTARLPEPAGHLRQRGGTWSGAALVCPHPAGALDLARVDQRGPGRGGQVGEVQTSSLTARSQTGRKVDRIC